MKKLIPQPKGFTVFFAVLVGSLSLAIGVAIYDITVRELDLSATATQSAYSIYAADTGAECALYWDNKYGGTGSAFATSSISTPAASITCNGQDLAMVPVTSANAATTTFTLQFTDRPYCATVEVRKYLVGIVPYTTVVSRGYNTACPPAVVAVPRLERTLQVSY